MSAFSKIKETSAEVIGDSRFMFAKGKDDIAERNLNSLKFCGIAGFIIAALLMIITPWVMPVWMPTWAHYAVLPTTLLLGLAAIWYGSRKRHHYYVVQGMCILFNLALLFFLGYINAYGYPDEPDYLFVGFLVIMPVLFTIRPSVMLFVILASAFITEILATGNKAADMAPHNTFSIIMGVLLSLGIFGVVYRAKTKQFRLQQRYLAESRTDLLTGLLNKRSYETLCENHIAGLDMGRRCALFVLDVDKFKEFNDTHGHAMGDEALKVVAASLKESFREDDKTGRIGGDEFSAFIVTSGAHDVLIQKALIICGNVEKLSQKMLNMKLTVSVGVATFAAGGISYADAFRVADAALYSAKHDENKEYEIRKVR